MSEPNHVSEEVTIPLVQRMSLREKIHLLKNDFTTEVILIAKIFFPLVMTSGVSYLRSLFSMCFLGRLHSPLLAGCSLALASANITAYSLFSGLTAGVETICSQAIGAKRYNLFRATIRRGMILLLFTSIPVCLVWINIKRILTMLKQDTELASIAHTFLLYTVLDLPAQSILQPLKAYLKTQSKTMPLLLWTALASVLHFLIMLLFVSYLGLEVKGVVMSGAVSNYILVAFLFIYIKEKKLGSNDEEEEEEGREESYEDSVREWKKLRGLAIPSVGMVCLEFWCYEIMILICADGCGLSVLYDRRLKIVAFADGNKIFTAKVARRITIERLAQV
ncbi:hypothetical protein N665_0861s0001 [Sinapis alba]|nr:hypothetical protein N665_0861s0001 [Sinapis alba]